MQPMRHILPATPAIFCCPLSSDVGYAQALASAADGDRAAARGSASAASGTYAQASSSGNGAPAGGGSGQSRTPVRDSMMRKLAERLRPDRYPAIAVHVPLL